MTRLRFCHMLTGLVISVGSLLCVPVLAEDSFSLLSDKQLEQHREFISSDTGFGLSVTNSATSSLQIVSDNGPILEINSPIGFDLVSPVDFDFSVKSRGGSPADMGSLKVEYKSAIWWDVTDRIKENAIFRGDRVLAKNVDLPNGKHKLRLTLEDQDNKATEVIVVFNVQRKLD